jgi:hypothetical protein
MDGAGRQAAATSCQLLTGWRRCRGFLSYQLAAHAPRILLVSLPTMLPALAIGGYPLAAKDSDFYVAVLQHVKMNRKRLFCATNLGT